MQPQVLRFLSRQEVFIIFISEDKVHLQRLVSTVVDSLGHYLVLVVTVLRMFEQLLVTMRRVSSLPEVVVVAMPTAMQPMVEMVVPLEAPEILVAILVVQEERKVLVAAPVAQVAPMGLLVSVVPRMRRLVVEVVVAITAEVVVSNLVVVEDRAMCLLEVRLRMQATQAMVNVLLLTISLRLHCLHAVRLSHPPQYKLLNPPWYQLPLDPQTILPLLLH